ncbi:hypothetical protein CYLTODRAFT_158530 [Cylindrobasidium torrendii FP15055 ss-10]|uniref:Uncharacterized protein n=1 Tax=Cylindrobasidium torrendii FP15055 ss-10 TaxID=1314674 RepID=A0A0D7AYK5_9AGAR|nr:hypothetical protein CYLTODRAFT_158530 [Cylindrobasidium torrendii FP15055 ss-10]
MQRLQDDEYDNEWPGFAEQDAAIDWDAIEALGLTEESIYGKGMPHADSLPSQGRQDEYVLRTTSTGWSGGRAAVKEVVALLWAWMHFLLGPILVRFKQVAFRAENQPWTVVKDRVGRNIAVRSPLLSWISGFTGKKDEILTPHPLRPSPFMQQCINEVVEFVQITTACEYGRNVRGPQWYHISGHDRQIRLLPDLRAWGKKNTGPLKWLFRKESPWNRLTGFANTIVQGFFPGIWRRFMRCRDYWSIKRGVNAMYGAFWQFCINWGEDRLLVDCWPHVDAANLAIGVCVIFIFGFFNSNEVCWLVIWEANIIIQLPAGVFLAYPSSLFYHFNINKEDIRADLRDARIVVGRRGVQPTPYNTEPLTKRNAKPEHWKEGEHIRGSAVWFCQASMYQPSELGVPTMQAGRQSGRSVSVNWDDLMERGEVFY